MKTKKYVHQLSRKLRSRNAKWIDENFVNPDELTLTMFSAYIKENIEILRYLMMSLKDKGYEKTLNLDDLDINLNMSASEFAQLAKDRIGDDIATELSEFSKNDKYDCKNKNILAVLWAKVIDNSLNRKTETNSQLIEIFFSIIENSKDNGDLTINDLLDETYSVFGDEKVIADYMNLVYVDIQSDNSWYDYTAFPPKPMEEEMNYDLKINNKEELLVALQDFKNLPSVIEFVKTAYLSSKEDKKDEFIREYKALTFILNILEDKKFVDDTQFDKDNNIGLNLNAKLYATEEFIKQNHVNYKNSEILAGLKSQSKKIANTALGKETTNVYGVWKRVVNAYIKQCMNIATKVKGGEITPSTRKYLKALGLVREREVVKDTNRLFSALRNKTDDARKLSQYLTVKQIENLKQDPFIDDAEDLYKELTTWASNVKVEYDKPLKLANLQTENLSPKLKELASVAKRHPEVAKTYRMKKQNSDAVQISLYDEDLSNE